MSIEWFQRPRAVAGLDIGSCFAKLVEVDHAGDEPEVVRVDVRALAPGAVVEGTVAQPAQVAETLGALVARGGGKPPGVVAAVGGHDVFLKRIEVGAAEGPGIADAVRWEAERRVPFDIESVRMDHHVLAARPARSQADVLLVAAKKELVESRLAVLARAGITPSVLEVEALALHNAFRHNYPGAGEGIAALADVGHQVTTVNVVEDGVPVASANLPIGSKAVETAVRRECGVEGEEAAQLVYAAARPPEADRHVQETARQIAAEIERATGVLAVHGSLASLGRVFLSGGGASIPGMAEGVADRLSAETVVANPFERVAIRPGLAGGTWLSAAPSMLLLALGLALRAA